MAAPPRSAKAPTALTTLSERELDVSGHLARGESNAEIAAALLSQTTVRTHVARILGKLGLRDRVQAVVLTSEMGYLQPGRAGG